MGKGDKRSAKGKRVVGSFGKSRNRKKLKLRARGAQTKARAKQK